MISNPKHGWSNFDLKAFHGTPSYLTDVPVDLLNAFIQYHTTGTGIAWFDEEGTEFTLVITPYAIYHSVSSNVPSHNYDVITVCYNDQIHMFQGTVNIQQTNDKPYIEITAKPHINYGDEITVFIPKGAVEFADNVGLR